MPDWLAEQGSDLITISTLTRVNCLGIELSTFGQVGASSPSSTAWPLANEGLFVPFVVDRLLAIQKMLWVNGATASGNLDVGIYDGEGNKIASAGSTAQGSISVVQSVTLSGTLSPGEYYYMCMAADNTTATYRMFSCTVAENAGAIGCLCQHTAFALPATLTPIQYDTALIPYLAISGRTLV